MLTDDIQPDADVHVRAVLGTDRRLSTPMLQLLLSTPHVEAFLDELVDRAQAALPGVSGCAVTMRRGDSYLTAASSSARASLADEAQYQEGTGPCLEALETGRTVVAQDLTREHRWASYPPRAVAEGVRSVLAVPMGVQGGTVGVLNTYADQPGLFDEAVTARVAAFAEEAEVAFTLAARSLQPDSALEQLQAAMQTRAVIDQALGVLMARGRCGADEAFARLRKVSQTQNRKMADLAAEIVRSLTGAAPHQDGFRR